MALMAELVFSAEIEFSDPSIATGQLIVKLIGGVHRLGTRQVGLVAGPFRPPFRPISRVSLPQVHSVCNAVPA
jgi:hypothetical protein